MKFFEVEYRRGQSRQKMILESANKLDAMKAFQYLEVGVPVKIREVSEPFNMKLQKFLDRKRNPVKNKRVPIEPYISTLRQIAVMLDAGMPINLCLKESVLATDDPMIKAIFGSILDDVEGGISITDASRQFEPQLGNLSISMFHLGEQTGTLAESIDRLAEIMEEIHENRVKLKKATRYPMFTIFAMMIAFTVVILFVVPQFAEIFASMKAELPFPTRLLIWVENALVDYGPFILGGGFLLMSIFSYYYKKSEKVALLADRMLLKVYIVGQVTQMAMLGRFIYIFNVLVHAGIPIIDAIRAAIGVVDNRHMRRSLFSIQKAIEEGRSLNNGFEESGLFSRMILQMLKAGEDAGALNTMLGKITKYYQDKYSDIIDNVSSMIEPILIAAIAGFVLLLAMGIFLPMWSMSEAMGM